MPVHKKIFKLDNLQQNLFVSMKKKVILNTSDRLENLLQIYSVYLFRAALYKLILMLNNGLFWPSLNFVTTTGASSSGTPTNNYQRSD
jgi:hypothetical protein